MITKYQYVHVLNEQEKVQVHALFERLRAGLMGLEDAESEICKIIDQCASRVRLETLEDGDF